MIIIRGLIALLFFGKKVTCQQCLKTRIKKITKDQLIRSLVKYGNLYLKWTETADTEEPYWAAKDSFKEALDKAKERGYE